MKSILLNPRVLLPLMIVMGMMVLGLRINDVLDDASSGRLFARAAHAESKSDASAPPAITPPALAVPAPAAIPSGAGDATVKPSVGDAAAAGDEDVSPAEIEVLKQLSSRREELDKRARDLDARDALLKVAEQRVDQKIKDMDTLRQQLQAMLNQANEAQAQQLENLVKMFETMKPEDAAKIFETLDMPVLLNVIQRMKPKSTAPIMAKMAPQKAKEVTVALTKQDQLPQVK